MWCGREEVFSVTDENSEEGRGGGRGGGRGVDRNC